jgi:hypothetical protein
MSSLRSRKFLANVLHYDTLSTPHGLQHNNIYIVALTKRNSNVTSIFVFLERLVEVRSRCLRVADSIIKSGHSGLRVMVSVSRGLAYSMRGLHVVDRVPLLSAPALRGESLPALRELSPRCVM